ncbi:hypothetical protein CKO18_16675 [Rhodoferax fermentans]|uniref:Uncharacterized protein n=2 Tax=Rhodoferax fermentans TaxID=28066 RepID=A0A1T1AW40_RHOFE|nr:hypothetical protein [Rhodoferax fermentans]OOV08178.1 hypothetical protein RF819_16930 [Rhodoferax fermentans]
MRNAKAARVILRTVVLAIRAVEDGSASFDEDSTSSRWSAALGAARSRLAMVRYELTEKSHAPCLDFVEPMVLIDALDAALWFGQSCTDASRLTNMEAMIAAEVVIDSLDEFLRECDALEKPEIALVH